ncbi:13958_t:CDS:2 [Ambispora leptoticha]|uniref:13958_t:CDS:1 n=1 Tax=Ambispora leptoticha TaxID=144679 RepID=A0A9N9A961_9GLOM|nr:13958_t:CDS:2 [Ambispora leptoticha]
MTAKTFTFKYDPNSSIERMFNEFKQAAEGKLVSVKPDEISSPHIEALLESINKNSKICGFEVEKILFCHIDELDLEELRSKKSPQKPANLRFYKYDLVINRQHFTKLEISPYYEKHNQEYLEALEKKGIKLSEKALTEKLITDDLIRKILVP